MDRAGRRRIRGFYSPQSSGRSSRTRARQRPKTRRPFALGFDVLRDAKRLGAVLLQFPFSFHQTPENLARLKWLLDTFGDYPLVVEVRHASWAQKKFYDLLHERGVGICNIDQPLIGRSIKPDKRVTSTIGYFRLHGRRYDTWFSDDPETPSHERYNYLYGEQELAALGRPHPRRRRRTRR